jgi:ParB family chromosome partitioning protein
MAKGMGLGKGLGALMGDVSLQSQEGGSVSLPIAQVEPGLKQPRKRFEPEALADLADSIREHGIIQPLTVRRLSSGYYQIIAGERRWRAAKQAGLTEVPALIIEADDRKVMELGLIENLQREDLNPVEEAMGYQALIQEYGLTQEEVAQRMGKSRPAIANTLRLLALPEGALKLLESGALSAGHARAVLTAPESVREELARQIVDQGLSVRQAEQLAKKLAAAPKAAPPPRQEDAQVALHLADLEKRLSGNLGRKVHIVHGRKKGRVELEYYDEQDLEALLALLGHREEGSL